MNPIENANKLAVGLKHIIIIKYYNRMRKCKGTIYKINNRTYCVGEKNKSKKISNKKKIRKTRKPKKSMKMNLGVKLKTKY